MVTRVKLILPLLLLSGAALADEAGMLRCRQVADPAARLACYDALTSPARAAEQFGREVRTAPPAVESIQSHIPGVFQGWQPQSLIRLANGQVWQVTDGSTGGYRLVDPKVKLERGALGSYFSSSKVRIDRSGSNASNSPLRVDQRASSVAPDGFARLSRNLTFDA